MLEKFPKGSEMSDVSVARNIIDEVFGPIEDTGRSRVIAAAYDAVKRVEKSMDRAVLALRSRRWTERRVRSIVDREAARIDHYEIEDLERVRLQEARHEFNKSAARAARMATLLAAADPDFYGPDIAAQIVLAGLMAGTGDQGPAAGEDFDRAGTDLAGKRLGRMGRAGNR